MAQKKYNVGDIRKKLLALGFDISEERIRHYEKLGLYKSRRNVNNDYREYLEERIDEIMRIIILVDLGTPINAFLDNDTVAVERRIETIKRALTILTNSAS